MFSEFTKEPEGNVAPHPVTVQSAYVNHGLDPTNGPPAEEATGNIIPSTQGKIALR